MGSDYLDSASAAVRNVVLIANEQLLIPCPTELLQHLRNPRFAPPVASERFCFVICNIKLLSLRLPPHPHLGFCACLYLLAQDFGGVQPSGVHFHGGPDGALHH